MCCTTSFVCVWVFIACVPIGYVPVYMVVIISEMLECVYIFNWVPQLCANLLFTLQVCRGDVRGRSVMVNLANLSVRFSELPVCYADQPFILISATVYSCQVRMHWLLLQGSFILHQRFYGLVWLCFLIPSPLPPCLLLSK